MKTLSPDLWLKQVKSQIDGTKEALEDTVVGTIFNIAENIKGMTPVDSGQARNSWRVSSTPNVQNNFNTNTRSATMEKQIRKRYGKVIYFVSANPYMGVLEYGGYPVPVMLGTRLKDGTYEKRSNMGYSKQAPEGMVGKSIVNFRFYLAEEARKAKRKHKI